MDDTYERLAREKGFLVIGGVDEAGRGPLAGPVCAGAVILPEGYRHAVLNDSKKLSEKRREQVYADIVRDAVSWSVGLATVEEIDSLNILEATFLAMRRAVDGLSVKPDFLYIDGNRFPHTGIPEELLIGGDAKCMSVAAASVIAKVTRDRILYDLDREYPQYQFAKHKGYGTKLHYEMLGEYGISPVHRKSFLKNLSEHIHE